MSFHFLGTSFVAELSATATCCIMPTGSTVHHRTCTSQHIFTVYQAMFTLHSLASMLFSHWLSTENTRGFFLACNCVNGMKKAVCRWEHLQESVPIFLTLNHINSQDGTDAVWDKACFKPTTLAIFTSAKKGMFLWLFVWVFVCRRGNKTKVAKGELIKIWNVNGLWHSVTELYFSKRTIDKQKKVNISNLKTTKFRIRIHFISQGIKWCLSFHFFKAFLLTVHLFSRMLW